MILVKVDSHSSHVLSIADEFCEVILNMNHVTCDLKLTVPPLVIIDEGDFGSSCVIIKILESIRGSRAVLG